MSYGSQKWGSPYTLKFLHHYLTNYPQKVRATNDLMSTGVIEAKQ